jgi:tetraacyldisaccharide 4'-kinase
MPSLPIPAFCVRYEVDGIYSGGAPVEAERLSSASVVAFAGIAKPQRFFSMLESIGIRTSARVSFRDHHQYSRREIDQLGGDILITTEKDAVRLDMPAGRMCCYVRISAKIAEFERLLSLIVSHLPNP